MGHTPGPWNAYEAVQNNGPNYWIVSTKAFRGTVTATCDDQANAALIAAAPKMLATLKDMVRFLELALNAESDTFGIQHNDALDALAASEATIAKAEGRQ